MAFTYDLDSTDPDSLAISKVRLELGDIVASGAGVRPDGSNLTDAELSVWLSEENANILLTTARACEALARAWSVAARTIVVGPRRDEFGEVAKTWSDMASKLREQHGGAAHVFSVGVDRLDGYSEAADSEEYET